LLGVGQYWDQSCHFACVSDWAAAASAAPVQYVKVCDQYGAQYYYSPGTDTCINANTGETRKQTEDGTVASKTALAQSVDDIDDRVARAFENASGCSSPGRRAQPALHASQASLETAKRMPAAVMASSHSVI
jgi:hypothetical protein